MSCYRRVHDGLTSLVFEVYVESSGPQHDHVPQAPAEGRHVVAFLNRSGQKYKLAVGGRCDQTLRFLQTPNPKAWKKKGLKAYPQRRIWGGPSKQVSWPMQSTGQPLPPGSSESTIETDVTLTALGDKNGQWRAHNQRLPSDELTTSCTAL